MIRCVIFDIGGVLIKSRMEGISERAGKLLGIDKNLLWAFWKSHKESTSKGKESIKNYCNLLDKKFNVKGSFETYIKIYEERQKTEINEEGFNLINKLKKKYKVGLISVVADAFAKMNKSIGLYSNFDVCILSCEVGFSKSEPGLYKAFLEKSGLKPEECAVIDDRGGPLEIAKGLGFKTILFENNQKLIKDLLSIDVKIN